MTARLLGDYLRVVALVLWSLTALVCIYSELRVTQVIRDAVAGQVAARAYE